MILFLSHLSVPQVLRIMTIIYLLVLFVWLYYSSLSLSPLDPSVAEERDVTFPCLFWLVMTQYPYKYILLLYFLILFFL